jgi:hypothetical protein
MLEIDAYVEEAYSTFHHDESVLLALPTLHRAGRPREPPALPTCSLESTCLHSMRARARTVSSSSLGPRCKPATCSWERSTCLHRMRSCRGARSARCHLAAAAALGRGLVAAAILQQIMHTQQQATAHRLACSAPSAAEMDKSCARGRASVATIHGGCSANCEFCCASKLLAPPFQIGGRFGAIPWMQKNFAS